MKELIKGEKYFIEAKFLYLDNRPRGDGLLHFEDNGDDCETVVHAEHKEIYSEQEMRERGSDVKGESFEFHVRLGDLQRCREDASGLTMFLNKCNVWSEKVIVTFPKQKTKVQKLLAELSSEEIDELKGLM